MSKSNWPTTSRHSRGYGTEWDKQRKRILERDNRICQCTDCKGGELQLRVATEVDHIVSKAEAKRRGWSKARTESDTNLQAINKECHKKKTLSEQGKVLKEKVVIGIDGWPVDS